MKAIANFKKALKAKKAVKIIAGIDNFDAENVLKVAKAAERGGADAIDIAASEDLIKLVRENTSLAVFVSSTDPEELLMAKNAGADALEIGNFDAYYRKGVRISAEEVLEIAQKTVELVGNDIMICATVPGHIDISKQVKLAQDLEALGVDLIQTEGSATVEAQSAGARGLIEKAIVSVANTVELCKNVEIPVMTASGITCTTAPMAFAAGASAVGVGSCVNKLSSELEMTATVMSIVNAVKAEKTSAELV